MGYKISLNKTLNLNKNDNFYWTDNFKIKDENIVLQINGKKTSNLNAISIQINSKESFNFLKKDKLDANVIFNLNEELVYICKWLSKKNLNDFFIDISNKEIFDIPYMNIEYSNTTKEWIDINILKIIINDFEAIIENNKLEKEIHNWIEKNGWIFGSQITIDESELSKGVDSRISRFDFTFRNILIAFKIKWNSIFM